MRYPVGSKFLRHVDEAQVVRNCLYSLMLVAKQREVRIAIVQFGLLGVVWLLLTAAATRMP